MEDAKSIRYRTKVATSAKGIKTAEFTVETVGYDEAEHLVILDNFAIEINKRYPVEVKE